MSIVVAVLFFLIATVDARPPGDYAGPIDTGLRPLIPEDDVATPLPIPAPVTVPSITESTTLSSIEFTTANTLESTTSLPTNTLATDASVLNTPVEPTTMPLDLMTGTTMAPIPLDGPMPAPLNENVTTIVPDIVTTIVSGILATTTNEPASPFTEETTTTSSGSGATTVVKVVPPQQDAPHTATEGSGVDVLALRDNAVTDEEKDVYAELGPETIQVFRNCSATLYRSTGFPEGVPAASFRSSSWRACLHLCFLQQPCKSAVQLPHNMCRLYQNSYHPEVTGDPFGNLRKHYYMTDILCDFE